MSGKQDRKLEELSVDGPAFASVVEQARKRQEARIGLRAMIDEWGPALRDILLRPGEIQRMVKDYREALRTKGDSGADEQAAELEAMLVEIRRRVEEGTLRSSRKAAAKSAADKEPASSDRGIMDQAGEADGPKSDEFDRYRMTADEREKAGAEAPSVDTPHEMPPMQATSRNARAGSADGDS
jgi:hypothetical protein